MNNTHLIREAALFASLAHTGQTRKFTGEPYFNHVAAVADMVSWRTQDAELIAAAYLHDTIEDCGVTHAELSRKFSPRVADLVQSLTNDEQALESMGKVAYMSNKLRHLTADALLIKLCDMLHNRSNTKSQRQIDNYLAILANLSADKPICRNKQHEQLIHTITAGAPTKKCPRCGGAWGFRYISGGKESATPAPGTLPTPQERSIPPTHHCGYCCHDFGFAHRKDVPPMAAEITRVVFSVGGHWGPAYSFDMSEERCRLKARLDESEIRPLLPQDRQEGLLDWDPESNSYVADFTPQPGEFQRLVRMLYRRAFLESWQREYTHDHVFDGTQWELELHRNTPEKAITYHGNEQYPPYYSTLLALIRPYFKRARLPFERR